MKRLLNAFRQIKLKDLLAPFVFLLLLIPSFIFRLVNTAKHRKLWLVAEQGDARDNGYHFYKYVRKEHPSDYCFYAAKPESAGYERVAKLGNIIKWGSLKHWLYYMSANLNISSQKSGNPCPIFWYIMHVTLGIYQNRVFLQHGVIKDDLKFVYYNCSKFKYFVCGAEREYKYVLSRFGYDKKNLLLTGLPRWDGLCDVSLQQKTRSILIMPTWRQWLGGDRNGIFKVKDFKKTDYFRYWNNLINNTRLIELIEKKNIHVYFYPHINMMKFLGDFETVSKNVHIVSDEEDIQSFLNKCNLMITDYTSAVFDFAFLKKPIIYYQFDENRYRENQYSEGYFKYRQDGFGDVLVDKNSVIDKIRYYVDHDFKTEAKYSKRMQDFFSLRDRCNCERVYKAIK